MAVAEDDIVITGFAARFPQADSLAEFKEKLYAGVDFVTDDETRWPRGHLGLPERMGKIRDLSLFDAEFFGVPPKQAHMMDPQMRLLLETSHEAIVDAGYDPVTLRGRKVGVFIGSYNCESGEAFNFNVDNIDGYSMIGSSQAMFANRIANSFDFHGQSMAIDTVCSSTLTALNEAVLALRSRQCEAAIVGGSSVCLNASKSVGLLRLGILSPDGACMTFDSRRFTCPSNEAQERLLRDVYAEARLDPRKVSYVEAHGTGTPTGDRQEMKAISNVFCQPGRETPLKVGAVKSNMGHGEPAAAVSSVAKVILAMETGIIAGNLHFRKPNLDIPSLHDGSIEVVDRGIPFSGGPVGISSFGLGGTSAHVILESTEGPHVDDVVRDKEDIPRLILVAGRSQDSLARTLERLEEEGPYPDSAYSLLNRVGQPSVKQFPYRGFALIPVDGSDREVVKVAEHAPFEKRPLWLVFTGMGCQWKGMAHKMMQFDVFSSSIHKSHEVLKEFGIDLIDLVTNKTARDPSMASVQASVAAIQ
ncbi:hypothetical protein V5799_010538, partial [Amblyomma americanum]